MFFSTPHNLFPQMSCNSLQYIQKHAKTVLFFNGCCKQRKKKTSEAKIWRIFCWLLMFLQGALRASKALTVVKMLWLIKSRRYTLWQMHLKALKSNRSEKEKNNKIYLCWIIRLQLQITDKSFQSQFIIGWPRMTGDGEVGKEARNSVLHHSNLQQSKKIKKRRVKSDMRC